MSKATILNFHGVGTPHAGVVADERPYWLDTDHFERVLDVIAARRDAGQTIEITFDDGNKSDLDIAAPMLQQRNLTAWFFVLMGRIDNSQYLSADDMHSLRSHGMSIGLHGRDHLDWRGLGADRLRDETVTAADELEQIMGTAPARVAIPFGAYNRAVIAHLKKLPFTAIMTSDRGRTSTDARVQPRTTLRADTTMADLDRILDDTYSLQARIRRQASRLLRQRIL